MSHPRIHACHRCGADLHAVPCAPGAWAKLDADAWLRKAARLPRPWSDIEDAIMDLRVAQARALHAWDPVPFPTRAECAARWGWTGKRARRVLERTDLWSDPGLQGERLDRWEALVAERRARAGVPLRLTRGQDGARTAGQEGQDSARRGPGRGPGRREGPEREDAGTNVVPMRRAATNPGLDVTPKGQDEGQDEGLRARGIPVPKREEEESRETTTRARGDIGSVDPASAPRAPAEGWVECVVALGQAFPELRAQLDEDQHHTGLGLLVDRALRRDGADVVMLVRWFALCPLVDAWGADDLRWVRQHRPYSMLLGIVPHPKHEDYRTHARAWAAATGTMGASPSDPGGPGPRGRVISLVERLDLGPHREATLAALDGHLAVLPSAEVERWPLRDLRDWLVSTWGGLPSEVRRPYLDGARTRVVSLESDLPRLARAIVEAAFLDWAWVVVDDEHRELDDIVRVASVLVEAEHAA